MLILTDYTREMSLHTSPASSKRPKEISKRSVSARGVQRYHSHSRRSCLPSAIEEDKLNLLRQSKTLSFQLIQTTTYSYSLLKHASALYCSVTTDHATTADYNHSATTADVTTAERQHSAMTRANC
ncbi:protein IQ-DOMAIN 1-like [Dorcoceras hygrometricum]|uniref:Protein IQ-DOMAIN 1-like n=1 Tax=Dorcoceras hygrometricum TaxID=472368 RepID=A0A2Z7D651_9LAMI|nr:protein IQ-DOMAIN 1-like [Dorcoceras hygrometricum]